MPPDGRQAFLFTRRREGAKGQRASTIPIGRSRAGATDPGVSLFVDSSQEDLFLAKLDSGRRLELYVADRSAGSYSLKDSGAAVREMVSCARALDPSGSEDPFALTIRAPLRSGASALE